MALVAAVVPRALADDPADSVLSWSLDHSTTEQAPNQDGPVDADAAQGTSPGSSPQGDATVTRDDPAAYEETLAAAETRADSGPTVNQAVAQPAGRGATRADGLEALDDLGLGLAAASMMPGNGNPGDGQSPGGPTPQQQPTGPSASQQEQQEPAGGPFPTRAEIEEQQAADLAGEISREALEEELAAARPARTAEYVRARAALEVDLHRARQVAEDTPNQQARDFRARVERVETIWRRDEEVPGGRQLSGAEVAGQLEGMTPAMAQAALDFLRLQERVRPHFDRIEVGQGERIVGERYHQLRAELREELGCGGRVLRAQPGPAPPALPPAGEPAPEHRRAGSPS